MQSQGRALQLFSGQAWRWSQTLLGLFFVSALAFWIAPSALQAQANYPLLVAVLLFSSVFVLWAYYDLGMIASGIFTTLSWALVFACAYKHGIFILNGIILINGIVFGICCILSRRTELQRMVRTSGLEDTQNKERLVHMDIERQRVLTGALRLKYQRYAALKEATEEFGTTLSRDRVVRLIAAHVLGTLEGAQSCLIFLVDPASHGLGLVFHMERGQPIPVRSKMGNLFDQWVLKRRKPLLVTDCDTDFRFRPDDLDPEERTWRSVMVCPLMVRQSLSGVVRVQSRSAKAFSQDELRLLDILASLGSVAIENARLYKRTEELAIHDGLTGLYVHRYIMQRLAEEHQRALAAKTDLSVLMCDLDHFKSYNDRYGHAAGDSVLKAVAKLLKTDMTAGELLARYGGEEFIIVLPGVKKEEARKRAEAIRLRVEAATIMIRREETHMTLSVGVAAFPTDTLDRTHLLRMADAALYKAKNEGRNRVCLS